MVRVFVACCVLALLGRAPSARAQENAQDSAVEVAPGPTLRLADLDDLALMTEEERAAAHAMRQESIEFLKDILLNRSNCGDQRAEMMLRLASLYGEEARDLASEDPTASRVWFDKAIKLLQQIVDSYPQYARSDEAVLELGRALEAVDRRQEAANWNLLLLKRYAESRHVPDAYLRLGEYYADVGNTAQARRAYEHAASFEQAERYAFAQYRLAWARAAAGETARAEQAMQRALAVRPPLDDARAARRLARVHAAAAAELPQLADLARRSPHPEDPTLGQKRLEAQATTVCANGASEACVAAWTAAVAWSPISLEGPRYQTEVVLAWKQLGEADRAAQATAALWATYGVRSAWASLNAQHPDLPRATAVLEQSLSSEIEAASAASARCLETGEGAACAVAIAANRTWLAQFPAGERSAEIRFTLAELLISQGQLEQAAAELLINARQEPPGPLARTSARAAVVTAAALVEADQADPVLARYAALTANETLLKRAIEVEIARFPDAAALDRERVVALARGMHRKGYAVAAAELFVAAIVLSPEAPDAVELARLALASTEEHQDLARLNTLSLSLSMVPGLGDAAFQAEISAITERTSFELIEDRWPERRDRCARAEAYVAFVEEFPSGPFTTQARSRAVACRPRRADRGT